MTPIKTNDTQNIYFPIGPPVTFVDAYGRFPLPGKVTRHFGTVEMLVEEASGVVHCCRTWRVTLLSIDDISLEDMLS